MRRVRAVAMTVGRLAQEVWQSALQLYAGMRGRRGAWAAASSIRRQYVFGAIGREALDAALRQRRRRKRSKVT